MRLVFDRDFRKSWSVSGLSALFLSGVLIIGCSSRNPVHVAGGGVVSRAHQEALSRAAEKAFMDVALPDMSGRAAYVEVVSMRLPMGEQIRQEEFIRSFLEELVARSGGRVVPVQTNADIKLTGRVNVFGAERVRHGFPLLWLPVVYYDNVLSTTVWVDIVLKDASSGRLITSEKAYGEFNKRKMRFLILFGPFYKGG